MEKHNRYFKILELDNEASLADVRRAYQHLKTLYSGDSIATAASAYDFSEDGRKSVLGEIDEAYTRLLEFFENKGKDPGRKDKPKVVFHDDFKEYLASIASFSGFALKQIRVKLGIDLKDMSYFTKIRRQYFEDIEIERFSSFPSEVYLRGYILEYAKYLSIDPVKVADDYIKKYKAWKAARERKA